MEAKFEARLPRRTGPRVNLLTTPGSKGQPGNARAVNNGVIAFGLVAVASWSAAALGVALLLGWHFPKGIWP